MIDESNTRTRQRDDRVRARKNLDCRILKTVAGGDAAVLTMVHQVTPSQAAAPLCVVSSDFSTCLA